MHLKKDALAALKRSKLKLGQNKLVADKINRAQEQVSRWLKGRPMSAMTAEHILRVLE